MNYALKTCEERAQEVASVIASVPSEQLTQRYLTYLGDYIMGALSKEERHDKTYLTDNRAVTVKKRETSWEGMAEKLEGEEGIYNLITNDKNVIFQPKYSITEQDLEEVPGLKELREAMLQVEESLSHATGRNRYLLKKQLIEMRKDQYILKNSYKPTPQHALTRASAHLIRLTGERYVDENCEPQSTELISFFNPKHVYALLNNYNALKLQVAGQYQDDFFYLLQDFDALLAHALQDQPLYAEIVRQKLKGATTAEVREAVQRNLGLDYTTQSCSRLWSENIPRYLSEYAKDEYLIWYCTNVEGAPLKRCSRCHQLKPASLRFFSRNNTAKDGFYCQCKQCRKDKKKEAEKL